MKSIDKFIDSITMYKLVLWGLAVLVLLAMVFGFLGFVSYSPLAILCSLIVLIVSAYVSEFVFAKIWHMPRNAESSYITAFILSLVLAPSLHLHDLGILALAGVLAMASKFVFSLQRKHIFNPAALSMFLLGLFGSGAVVWWVATPALALPVAILGFFIIRKLYRIPLFKTFAITSFVVIFGVYFFTQTVSVSSAVDLFKTVLLSWPLLFFGMVMLTEPQTVPPTDSLRSKYGMIVGFLFAMPFHIGPLYSTPEFALIVGNIFSYIVSPKGKVKLSFVTMRKRAGSVYEFLFTPERKFNFVPGQYLEWTLEHDKPDQRGNRRYFTIASSPTEEHVHLGVRVDPIRSSTFKKKLLELKPGDTILAGSLEGEFTMPKEVSKKLVFIAGGVGITPFRSQLKYLEDIKQKRDIVLMYSCMTQDDFAFHEETETARHTVGIKVVYIATKPGPVWSGKTGYITSGTVKEEIPDYLERDFYLSGPNVMVENYENMLKEMGVKGEQIHTDYFPGY